MSLSNYIAIRREHFKQVLLAADPMPEHEKFPCPCCKGEGVLGMVIELSHAVRSFDRIKNRSGEPIVFNDAVACVVCAGTGVDREEFVKSLEGA